MLMCMTHGEEHYSNSNLVDAVLFPIVNNPSRNKQSITQKNEQAVLNTERIGALEHSLDLLVET